MACGKKISMRSFSPSLLKERAFLSQVNIGIKYHILLHAFPQLHHLTPFTEKFNIITLTHPLSTKMWINYIQK